jgi:hypothetical protein
MLSPDQLSLKLYKLTPAAAAPLSLIKIREASQKQILKKRITFLP